MSTWLRNVLLVVGALFLVGLLVISFYIIKDLNALTAGSAAIEAPAVVAVQEVAASGDESSEFTGGCWADKVANWDEIDGAGPQRAEISTGVDIGHLDYYPRPGVPSVSIIVHPGEEEILSGHGGLWQFPRDRCAGFDFIEDAKRYAGTDRDDNGHSGLVYATLFDYLNGKDPVVNVHGIDPALIEGPVFWEESEAAGEVNAITGYEADERVLTCPEGEPVHNPPVDGEPWTVGAEDRYTVVNFWTNWKGFDFTDEHKLFLKPGETVKLKGGGSSFSWPSDCGDVAEANYDNNPLKAITLKELAYDGLVADPE